MDPGEKFGYFDPPRVIGDILILSDFSGGGKYAEVSVHHVVGFNTKGEALFETLEVGDAEVAINNAVEYPVPTGWNYVEDYMVGGEKYYPVNAFYEGYIDLADINNGGEPMDLCLSGFLLETRSSDSFSASLDDFVAGAFTTIPEIEASGGEECQNPTGATQIQLCATSDDPDLVYQWYYDEALQDSVIGASMACITVEVMQTDTFWVTGTNEINCVSLPAMAIAKVYPLPAYGTEPVSVTKDACTYDTQEQVNAAFTAWVNAQTIALNVHGGVDPQLYDDSGEQTIPDVCGGSATVTWTIEDLCDTLTDMATFELIAPDPVSVFCNDTLLPRCVSEADITAAYEIWKNGFTHSGGCVGHITDNKPDIPEWSSAINVIDGGMVTFTYEAWDLCDTAEVTCTFEVPPCPDQFCTLTQGFYGNPGGLYCDGTTTEDLLALLLADGLYIGCTGHSYELFPADVSCVIDILPGGGPSKVLASDYTCGDLVSNQGRLFNTLLAQAITMGLNLHLDPTLGSLTIESYPYMDGLGNWNYIFWTSKSSNCGEPGGEPAGEWKPFYLPESVLIDGAVNVMDLFEMANDALCGMDPGVSPGDLAQALGAINEAFDECAFWTNIPPEVETEGDGEGDEFSSLSLMPGTPLKVYPNPFRDQVIFEFSAGRDSQGLLEIYNMLGQKVAVILDRPVKRRVLNRIEYSPVEMGSGILIYRLVLDDVVQTGRIIYQEE